MRLPRLRRILLVLGALSIAGLLLTHLLEDDLDKAWGLLDRGHAHRALTIFDQVREEASSAHKDRREAEALIGRARCLVRMGDYPAFNKLVADLSMSPAVQQDKRLRMLLHFVQTSWVDREPHRALPALESGLALARELHSTKYEGRLTGALGIYYYYAGDASKATLILDALKMAIRSGDEVYVLRWGMVVTIGLAGMGHQERALDLMKLGLLFGRTIGDIQDQQVIYGNMASIYSKMGRDEDAWQCFEEGLRLAREIQDPAGEALLLSSRGEIRMAAGDYRGAIDDFQGSRRKNHEINFARGESENLGLLAEAATSAGLYEQAERAATEAIDIDRQLGQLLLLPYHVHMLAKAQRGRGQRQLALENYDRAVRLVHAARIDTPSHDMESGFIGEYSELYREYIEMLLVSDAPADRAKAFEVLEMYRGRSIADALSRAVGSETDAATEPLLAKAQELNRTIAASEGALATMADNTEKVENAMALAESVGELRSIEREIRGRRPEYAMASYPQPVTAAQLATLLKPEEALLSYSLGPQQSHLFVVTRELFSVVVLSDQKRITDLVMAFRDAATKRRHIDEHISRNLYEVLMSPAEDLLAGKTTINVVPEGVLNLLPFGSLLLPDGSYLIERFAVVNCPSATVLTYLRRHPIRVQPPKTVLALGSPSYPADEPIVAATARSGNARGTILPYSGLEVRNILREIGGDGDALLGTDATVTKLLSLDLDQYAILHFAVHAAINSDRPEASALVLSSDPQGKPGYLYARDIVKAKLNANLVTLSACDTGVGKLQGGEGVSNMTRAFFYSGARAVVSSLWYVEDAATAQLMTRFYRNIRCGLTLTEAMRQAKLDLIRDPDGRYSIYHWAPFVLNGDGSQTLYPRVLGRCVN